tara:strand:- start:3263 stop:3625 length:363 start_codon:yes stop_codon:yes gene_type:complete
MDPLESIKHNKNLLRVAAELSGKGDREGNDQGFDEIEAISTKKEEPAVSENILLAPKKKGKKAAKKLYEKEEEISETVKQFTDLVIDQLSTLEENLDTELVDEDLDFAINKIIDNLISKD